jgi:hypothetical protein
LIESPTRPQLDSGTPSTSEEADTGSRRYGGNHRRNEERIDLKTKYFQITERSDVVNDVIDVIGGGDALSTSTARPYSRPPSKILVKKLAKIPIAKSTTEASKNSESFRNSTDLCKTRPDLLECEAADQDDLRTISRSPFLKC